jgi:hypothetical protein
MNKKKPPFILIFISVIIAVGLIVFVFRSFIIDKFLNSGLPAIPSISSYDKDNSLDLTFLQGPKAVALKDTVVIFNYNDMSASQDALAAIAKAQSDSQLAALAALANAGTPASSTPTTTPFVREYVGNSNPFLTVTKK